VLVQRREPALPDGLAGEAGTRVFTERADLTSCALILGAARQSQRQEGLR
jgi:hypothetical protein